MARFLFFPVLSCKSHHAGTRQVGPPSSPQAPTHVKGYKRQLQPTVQATNNSSYYIEHLHVCLLYRPYESPAKREPACFPPSQLAPSLSGHFFRARLPQTASPVNHHGSSSRFLHHLEPSMDNPAHQMVFMAEHQSQPHHVCITSRVSIQLAPAYMEAVDS